MTENSAAELACRWGSGSMERGGAVMAGRDFRNCFEQHRISRTECECCKKKRQVRLASCLYFILYLHVLQLMQECLICT
jgi:hypothetical protein